MVCHHFSATPAACQASSRRLEEGKGQGGLYTRGGGGGGGGGARKEFGTSWAALSICKSFDALWGYMQGKVTGVGNGKRGRGEGRGGLKANGPLKWMSQYVTT